MGSKTQTPETQININTENTAASPHIPKARGWLDAPKPPKVDAEPCASSHTAQKRRGGSGAELAMGTPIPASGSALLGSEEEFCPGVLQLTMGFSRWRGSPGVWSPHSPPRHS